MTVEGLTKIQKSGKNGIQVHIPAAVRIDSQNPIKLGDEVIVKIDGEKMIIVPARARQDAEITRSAHNREQ